MRRIQGALCAAVAACALLAGCGGPIYTVPGQGGAPPSENGTPDQQVTPVSVDVDSIGAHSSLIPLGLDTDGTAKVPDVNKPKQAGWIRVASTNPEGSAPLVVLGHIDGNGIKGVFYQLSDIKPGAKVVLTMSDGSKRTYTVTRYREIVKTAFPTQAVYAPTPLPTVVLVSCGGVLDRKAHSYLSSEIAWATQDPAA